MSLSVRRQWSSHQLSLHLLLYADEDAVDALLDVSDQRALLFFFFLVLALENKVDQVSGLVTIRKKVADVCSFNGRRQANLAKSLMSDTEHIKF